MVSPFAPYGPTLSLLFVLAVAAIKAAVEDRKRHQEDRRTNSSTAHVLHADGAGCPRRALCLVLHILACRENVTVMQARPCSL